MKKNIQENIEGDLNFLILEYLRHSNFISLSEKETLIQKVNIL